jgi:quinol monooxygenase YgiN
MKLGRREFVFTTGAAITSALLPYPANALGGSGMYGIIGKAKTVEGKRDEFIKVLLEGTSTMPGCLSYIVAKDPADENAVWITEVWDSMQSHAASLKLPSVQAAISKGRPMIAGFGERFETEPVGGYGMATKKE